MKCVRCNTVWSVEHIDGDPEVVIFRRVGGILYDCPSCSDDSVDLVTISKMDGVNAERIARNVLCVDTTDHYVTIGHRATETIPRAHLGDYVSDCHTFARGRWERAADNPARVILDLVDSHPQFSVLIHGNHVVITLKTNQ